MSKYTWNDREVVFVEFNIKVGRVVRAAFAEDDERGAYTQLMHSARYADDGKPVFHSVEEIEALPFRLSQIVMTMATAAAQANAMVQQFAIDDTGKPILDAEGKPVPLH